MEPFFISIRKKTITLFQLKIIFNCPFFIYDISKRGGTKNIVVTILTKIMK